MPTEGQLMWGTHIYVPSEFDPSSYRLKPVEVRALIAQVPALRALDNLYFLQNGGMHNLRLWEAVNAAARSRGEAVKDYRMRVSAYGGPFDSTGKKFKPAFSKEAWDAALAAARTGQMVLSVPYEELVREEDAPTGADVFVNETTMNKEEVGKWGQQQLDAVNKGLSQAEKWAMKHPLLNMSTRARLVNDGGRYTILEEQWADRYPELAKTAADSLVAAGEICAEEFPQYTAILNATARGILTGDNTLRDALLPRNDSRLYTMAGLTERMGDSLGWDFVWKNGFDGFLALVDQEETAKLEGLAQLAPAIVQELPKECRNPKVYPPRFQVLNVIYEAGMSGHCGASLGARNWPNTPVDRLLANTSTYIVNHGRNRDRVKYLIKPVAEAMLPPGQMPDDAEMAEFSTIFDAGHELLHGLGVKRIDNSALEEGRANAGALWQSERMLGSKERADRYCKVIFPMMVRFVRLGLKENGEVTGVPHAVGTNALINSIFERGSASLKSGVLEMDTGKIREVAGEYCIEATTLLAGREQGPIEEFFKPHKLAREETRQLVEAMKARNIPRTMFHDYGTLEELEVSLHAYLPEAESMAAAGAA